MHVRSDGGNRIRSNLRELRANRVRERDVRGKTVAEKRADAPLGAIEKLIRHDDVEGWIFLLEAPDGACRNDALDAEHLESEDVGAEVQVRWKQPVSSAVPCEKRDSLAAQRAE